MARGRTEHVAKIQREVQQQPEREETLGPGPAQKGKTTLCSHRHWHQTPAEHHPVTGSRPAGTGVPWGEGECLQVCGSFPLSPKGRGVIEDLLLCFLGSMSLQPGRVPWAHSLPLIHVLSLKQGVQIPLALTPSVLLAPSLGQAFWTVQSRGLFLDERLLVQTTQLCRTVLPATRSSKSPFGLVGPERDSPFLPLNKAPAEVLLIMEQKQAWNGPLGKAAALPARLQDLPSR